MWKGRTSVRVNGWFTEHVKQWVEFFQKVPQDVTIEERQAEVFVGAVWRCSNSSFGRRHL